MPEPRWLDYPELLNFGAPRLLGYPPEATLAEKLHAVVVLGFTNTRMKDYYDLWMGHRLQIAAPEALGLAVRHTFGRRGTPVPAELPKGLTAAFADEPGKNAQWLAFLRKSNLQAASLHEVVQAAAELGGRAFDHARRE